MAKKKRTISKPLSAVSDKPGSILLRWKEFADQHKNWMYGSLAGVIIIIAGIFGIRYYSAISQDRAYVLYEKGMEIRREMELKKNIPSTDRTGIDDFDEVLTRYPDTEAARLTCIAYGDYEYRSRNYDQAIGHYLQALKAFESEPFMKAFVLNSIGYCYEEKKDYKTASGYFTKIVDSENKMLKDLAHFSLARAYEAMGDAPDALSQYEIIVKDYPDSIHFQAAEERMY
ncbi:MAG: tetratricopeptide repeat protein [Desulfobacterales bacterium]|nr:tetratricopeptide repeat protein [Desulfobacterales bacterium]